MRCIRQAMSYLELTLVKLELSSNAFSCQILVSVLSREMIPWQWRKS